MPYPPPEQTIRQRARARRLDPDAVIAVAMGEGGLVNRDNDRGDGGTSFGPFQEHEGGALPRHLWGNPDAADAWAWSPAGIDHALSQMASSGAAGLSGRAAVEAIIRKFERPADPDTSVRNAIGRLGASGGGGNVAGLGPLRSAPASAGVAGSGRSGLAMQLLTSRRQGTGRRGLLEQMLANRLPPQPAGPAAPTSPGAPPMGPAPSTRGGGSLSSLLASLGLDDAITSGERSVERNRQVGGSPTSNHLPGGPEAFDLDPSDPDIPRLLARAEQNPGEFKELFGPADWHIKNGRRVRGRFPDHDDHWHVSR